MQYLLDDPSPHRPPDYGGFATGLRFYDGGRKPSYDAYRLPVFIATSGSHHRILVWGCARPARAFGNPKVAIEFTSGARGRFTRVATAVVRNPRGYFEAWITVRHAGRLRLAWTYPGGATAYSRTVSVSVR
jgi:hypothetical protein